MVSLDDLADHEIAELRHKLEDAERLERAARSRRGVRARPAAARPELSRAVVSAYRELAFCQRQCAHRGDRRAGSTGAASICRSASRTRSACRRNRSPACCASTGRSILPSAADRAGLGRPRRRMRLCRPGAPDARIRRIRRRHARLALARARRHRASCRGNIPVKTRPGELQRVRISWRASKFQTGGRDAMTATHAIEAPRIYPTFRYRDAAKMIDWLARPSALPSMPVHGRRQGRTCRNSRSARR